MNSLLTEPSSNRVCFVHRLAAVAVGDAIVEEVLLALVHDGHGQAGNPVLLDGRLHGGIDGGAQLVLGHRVLRHGGLTDQQQGQRGGFESHG